MLSLFQRSRKVTALLLLLLVIFSFLALNAQTVYAKTNIAEPISIVGTDNGVNIRTAPSLDASIIGKIPEGSTIQDYICFTYGTVVGNPGTGLWFKVDYNGTVGYYSSYYDTVPPDDQSPAALLANYGLIGCNMTVNTTYDRNAAVQWAMNNAMQPSTWMSFSTTCTWFVSRALWAGGFTQTSEWNPTGAHGAFGKDPGTANATLAPGLLAYLISNYRVEWQHLGNLNSPLNAVPDAQVGDIVAYQWTHSKDQNDTSFTPDHLAFITGFTNGNEPLVSEWGTAEHGSNHVSYQQRPWTFSQNQGVPLRVEYPANTEVEVYLLHFLDF